MTLSVRFSNKIQALLSRAQELYGKKNWTMTEAEEFLALRESRPISRRTGKPGGITALVRYL